MRPPEWRPPSTRSTGGQPRRTREARSRSPQGSHTVSYWSVDTAGNTESATTTPAIKVDLVKPSTTLTTSPASPDGSNNWFQRSSVTFTLAATDATSGVANRYYTIDGGGQQTYSGTVTISTQGDHTVTYWSVDEPATPRRPHHPHQARQRQAGHDDDHEPREPRRRRTTGSSARASPSRSAHRTRPPAPPPRCTRSTAAPSRPTAAPSQSPARATTPSPTGRSTTPTTPRPPTPPTSSSTTSSRRRRCTTSPASPDGTNNWFKQASVTFTLAATDATSGVANRFYTVDGGGQQTYSGTVTISTPGRPHRHLLVGATTPATPRPPTPPTSSSTTSRPTNSLALTNKTGGSFVEREHGLLPRRSRRVLLDPEHRRGRHLRCGLEQLPRARRNGHRLDAHHARREDDALRRPLRLEPLQLDRRHDSARRPRP